MVFVFDLDDTVCDTDAYSTYYINKFIKENNLPFKQIADVVRYTDAKFDWTPNQALAWYKKYGDEMFLHFPVKGNAVKVINKLYDMGHTIVISTARSTDWHVEPKKKTIQWLKKVGLKYHKLFVSRSDKEKICEMVDADVFVDDDIKLTTKVNEYFKSRNKGKVFLSSTDYNKTQVLPKDLTVINNFNEMLDYLNLSDDEKETQV